MSVFVFSEEGQRVRRIVGGFLPPANVGLAETWWNSTRWGAPIHSQAMANVQSPHHGTVQCGDMRIVVQSI
jgi:hypothetical protein